MRAAVYAGSGQVRIEDVAEPTPSAGEVLLRVSATTVCGTDLRIARGVKSKGVRPPVVLGHEVAGTVIALGSGVEGLDIGTVVGITPSVACGSCRRCQAGVFNLCARARVLGHDIDGGMAEAMLVPADAVRRGNVVPAPAGIAPEEVALAEPLSCVLHGQELLGVSLDDVVVILGGGAIGQLHAQVARARGASTVIVSEPVASRRTLAKRLGADIVVDPLAEDLAGVVTDLTEGRGADAVVVCVGVPQLVATAFEIAGHRGRVNLFAGFPADAATPFDANAVHYRELTVTGSSNSTVADYRRALALIGTGRVDVGSLVTHRYPIDQVETALQMAESPDAVKVAIVPGAVE